MRGRVASAWGILLPAFGAALYVGEEESDRAGCRLGMPGLLSCLRDHELKSSAIIALLYCRALGHIPCRNGARPRK